MKMFKNYLQIAIRNLLKNRLYSSINILGLAIGLGACLMLMLFILDEVQYDQFWRDSEQLYRLDVTYQSPGREPFYSENAPGKAKQALANYFSQEISQVTRLNMQYPIIQAGDKIFEEPIYLTDAETADILDVEVLKGDFKQTLSDNSSIAISQELAIKYFGSVDAIGKIMTISNYDVKHDYRVGAVYKKLPHNSVISFNALIKINEDDYKNQPFFFDNWFSPSNTIIFKINPNVAIESINKRLVSFVDDNIDVPPYYAEQYSLASEVISFSTLKLQDVHLNSPGKKSNLYIFASITLLILVIACINFTNLSIAKSTRRAREVVIRKVVGASKSQLIIQFLGETIFIALIALIVGVCLVELLLPYYNDFLGRELSIGYSDPATLTTMLGLVLISGVIGGIYPAFILSSFRPAAILNASKSTSATGTLAFSNVLVTFQFIVSISLIICAVVIYAQRQHTTNMELGFDKDHIVILHGVGRSPIVPKQQAIRQQIKSLSGVVSATYIDFFPATGAESTTTVTVLDDDTLAKHIISIRNIDFDYQDTFGARLLAGRMFSDQVGLDVSPTEEQWNNEPGPFLANILVNEMAIKQLGLGEQPIDAIDKTIQFDWGKQFDGQVVGVIANANYKSVRETIRPEVYFLDTDGAGFLAVRFIGPPSTAVATLQQYWQKNIPDVPFVRTFVDDLVEGQFVEEQRMALILAVASSLAIIVACLGLFGLASFTAERRTKEIGLRKVLGANVSDIVKLLVWQFSKPVIIASVFSSIISYILMSRWLEEFPFRIDTWIIIPICLMASLVAVSIAWLTVGGNAIKIARARPIKALRHE